MNAVHERNHVLRERLRAEKLLTPEIAAQLEQPWRTNGLLVQVVFFVLTSIALGAAYALFNGGLFPGVVAIVTAEYLINRWRWFFTGVEAALWLGGLFALISELPSSGTPESVLVIAAACAVAGARVRNPLFGAAAAGIVAYYFEDTLDTGVLVALILATLALLALGRTWRRPTTEWLFIAMALVLPLVGAGFVDREWRDVTIILYTAYGALALILGLRLRHHACFLAAMIGFGVAAMELGDKLDAVPFELRLAAGGTLLLALAFTLNRALRDRTSGFVLTPAKLTPMDEELQLAATFALKPETPEVEAPKKAGGGSFGGAGASGDY
jgi:hypothetical protein